MGQKTSPIGFRLVLNKRWKSIWYADKKEFGDLLGEDHSIRKFLLAKPCCVGASHLVIKRMSGKIEIVIHTSRPGLVIGKKGAEIDTLREELRKFTGGKEVWISVEEIKRPNLNAKLVADGIGKQLKHKMPFKRALKKALQSAKEDGAAGIKVEVSGRLGGADIARTEWYREGRVPLHTLRAEIDYAEGRVETTYGSIGIHVWVYLGDVGSVRVM
jgi:small subunit ribosomal protein S3